MAVQLEVTKNFEGLLWIFSDCIHAAGISGLLAKNWQKTTIFGSSVNTNFCSPFYLFQPELFFLSILEKLRNPFPELSVIFKGFEDLIFVI